MAANIDVFDTPELIRAFEATTRASSFLRDRYFGESTNFSTNNVIIDTREGGEKAAPFVAPRKEGVTVTREGYTTTEFTPPYIAPRRVLTYDDINRRGFGEAILNGLTPAARAVQVTQKDMQDLDAMITRTEEQMAASIMLNSNVVVKEIADDVDTAEEKEIRFYSEEANPYTYTPETKWNADKPVIFGDILAMIRKLTTRGLGATDLIVAPDVADALIKDDDIRDMLNNRRFELGQIDPTPVTYPGASAIGVLNVYGHNITVFSYDAMYEDASGKMTAYIPDGKVILTAPAAGARAYGRVTQLEQASGMFADYTGDRIPKVVASAEGNTRTITLKSRPLLYPKIQGSFISATVL